MKQIAKELAAFLVAGHTKILLEKVYDQIAKTEIAGKLHGLGLTSKEAIITALGVLTFFIQKQVTANTFLKNVIREVGVDAWSEMGKRIVNGFGDFAGNLEKTTENQEQRQILSALQKADQKTLETAAAEIIEVDKKQAPPALAWLKDFGDAIKSKLAGYKRVVIISALSMAAALVTAVILIGAGTIFESEFVVNLAKLITIAAASVFVMVVLPALAGLYLIYSANQFARKIVVFAAAVFLFYFCLSILFFFLPVGEYPALSLVLLMAVASVPLGYFVVGKKINPKYFMAWRWLVVVGIASLIFLPGLKTAGAYFVGKANSWLISLKEPPLKNPRRLLIDLANIDRVIFYNPDTGNPVIFYCLPAYGKYEFFSSSGFCPSHGRKLKPVTDSIIRHWKRLLELELENRAKIEEEEEEEKKLVQPSSSEEAPSVDPKVQEEEPQSIETSEPPKPESPKKEEDLPEWIKKARDTLKRRTGSG